jgi:hypothetical protein
MVAAIPHIIRTASMPPDATPQAFGR